jgi:hypothetical protein
LQNSTLGFSLTLKDSTSGAHKDFRVNAGTLEIINQANTLVIASVTDAGVFNTVGDINAGNNIISKSVVSTYGDLQTRALNSGGDASLTFYNESAAQKGRLYWSHSGHIFLSNSAALVPFVLTDSSVVQASGGILGRSGVSGGYSANIYNFQYSTIFEAWVNNTFLGQVAFVSDYRTKKDVIDLPAMWDTVKKLRPIKYTQQEFSPPSHLEYISQRRQRDAKMVAQDKAYTPEKIPGPLFTADDTERWGFMAHELQETLVMSAATGAKDAAAAIQSPNPLTIIAALTKALQETMTRVEALEAKP